VIENKQLTLVHREFQIRLKSGPSETAVITVSFFVVLEFGSCLTVREDTPMKKWMLTHGPI
jgi:hypothetical protein